MSDAATPSAGLPGPDWGELEAPVRFDLGETSARLELLAALQPGYVFELSRGLSDAVTISVNGAPLGRGELVRVGDRLGVRVVEVLPDAVDHP